MKFSHQGLILKVKFSHHGTILKIEFFDQDLILKAKFSYHGMNLTILTHVHARTIPRQTESKFWKSTCVQQCSSARFLAKLGFRFEFLKVLSQTRGLGLVVYFPLGCVVKINTPWLWPWPWPWDTHSKSVQRQKRFFPNCIFLWLWNKSFKLKTLLAHYAVISLTIHYSSLRDMVLVLYY